MAAPKKAPAKKATSARKSAAPPRGDLTGRRKQEALDALTEEQKAEQARITTATAAEQEADDGTIDDYTGEGVTEEEKAQHGVEIVEEHEAVQPTYDPGDDVEEIDDQTETVVFDDEPADEFETSSEIVMPREDCRFIMGAGTLYQFSGGRRAKVPFHVAQHMREKGLIW